MATSSAIASIIYLGLSVALLLAGCSSSQQTVAPSAPPSNAISADAEVNTILEKSCFQCHSSNGTAPWYAAVSPTYLASNSARQALNFSDWPSYDTAKRADELKSIAQAVGDGSMPPGDYTALDHSAALAEDQKQVLLKWAAVPAH
jgi:hypothetical protein